MLLEHCHGASVHVRNKNGQMPLHTASRHHVPGTVLLLLKFGADVDAQDNDAMTPLHLVSQTLDHNFGDEPQINKTARVLLEHGASVHMQNKNGQIPLHTASQYHVSSIVASLLKFGADVDALDNDTMTPLHLVSQSQLTRFGDSSHIAKTAQVLLEHGASVHMRNKKGQMPLHTASCHGLSDIVALLLKFGADVDAQDNDTMTPLHLVSQSRLAMFGDYSHISKTAQLLLEHGASVRVRNKNGQTPLHAASHNGLSDIVALLLKFGADVDAQDNDTMTPLFLVSEHLFGDDSQTTKTAQLLLEHGASVHVRNKTGWMPLHTASHRGHSCIVALLLKFGADVDAQDNDTMTPLLLVSQSGFGDESQTAKTAQLLLEHGASVHMRNKNGQMPLHLASPHGISGIVEFLLKFGADVDARDKRNITPLHFAVTSLCRFPSGSSQDSPFFWGVIKTTKLLLEHGANFQMKNDKGETLFQVASRRGWQEIVDVLSNYMQIDGAMPQ